MNSPKIVVFAYHDVGHACLQLLIERGEPVVAVFTHQDQPQERIWFHSVAELAHEYRIDVHQPMSVNTPEWIDRIRDMQPALLFSFYYRHLICQDILDLPRLGAFNMHGSLLPKYRGRAPINWAVLRGEKETGVTLHYMVKRADAGDIVDQQAVSIGPEETARDVYANVTKAARIVLNRQLENLKRGTAPRRPQNDADATTFGGRTPEDGIIDWSQSAQTIFNLIRAVTHPYPGAFTVINGRRFYLWRARPIPSCGGRSGHVCSTSPLRVTTGNGCLEILEWQWQEGPVSRPGQRHDLRLDQILGDSVRTPQSQRSTQAARESYDE